MKATFARFRNWLAGLSFRSGLIVAGVCVLCYVISFAQMLLPISVGAKSVLWVIFYGFAKAFQYTAIAILGKSGIQRIRQRFKPNKQ
ncbi:MAG: hypothetical protein K2O88_00500 [Paramuribaculum sp.]|nr:hypothetical protein [Paramuribaculum sp.]